jgi:hypothetical protein
VPPRAVGDDAGKTSAATALVRLARERYTLRVTPEGEPFAMPIDGPRVARLLRGGRGSLRAELADAYFETTGRAAPQQALTDALLTLEGAAHADGGRAPLHLRVAQHGDRLVLDLGDEAGRAVLIGAGGWSVTDSSPVLFRCTATTGQLPEPVPGGSLDEFWPLLNVAEADRPLLLAWLIAALFPDIPHPVLDLQGEQGTGKTTTSCRVAGMLDPSPAQTRKPPRDTDGWVTAAAGSWVVAVDNVSTVPDWWSDAICRAVTGDGDVRRRLYTDDELVVIKFRRAVLVNGIDLGALRGDLADRLVVVNLERIDERRRRLDADLATAWREAHPRILGALLDLAAGVLAVLPTLDLERLPRMADFGRLLAAVDAVLGTDGMARYARQAEDLAADAVEADPVLAAMVARVRDEFVGTSGELLDRLRPDDDDWRPPRGWPANARALTALLRKNAPALRRLGWAVDDVGQDGKARAITWRLCPSSVERQSSVVECQSSVDERRHSPSAPAPTCDVVENGRKSSVSSVATPLLLAGALAKEDQESEGQAAERLPGNDARPTRTLAEVDPPPPPGAGRDRGTPGTAGTAPPQLSPIRPDDPPAPTNCTVCGYRLDPVLVAAGEDRHPGCHEDDPGTGDDHDRALATVRAVFRGAAVVSDGPPDGDPISLAESGPCARCGATCRCYGPQGSPLCTACQRDHTAPDESRDTQPRRGHH